MQNQGMTNRIMGKSQDDEIRAFPKLGAEVKLVTEMQFYFHYSNVSLTDGQTNAQVQHIQYIK